MAEGHPYDPNVLKKLAASRRSGGAAVQPPRLPGPPSPNDLSTNPDLNPLSAPGFEHYPSKPEAFAVAFAGFKRIFSYAGRIDRSQERGDRLERRREVIRHIGDRMTNPRAIIDPSNDKPEKLIAWIGVGKSEQVVGHQPKAYEGDFTQMGKWLRESDRDVKARHDLRPTIKTERIGYQRLEDLRHKIARLHDERRHLGKSFGRTLDRNDPRHLRLSPGERTHMGQNSRKIAKRDRQIDRLRGKFDRIADSRDWRGRINDVRIRRARSYPVRADRRRTRNQNIRRALNPARLIRHGP